MKGQRVRLPDLSRYFRIAFATSGAADSALSVLQHTPCVWLAERVPDSTYATTDPVNDPLFGDSPEIQDRQWDLKNDGGRNGLNNCDHAVIDMDIRIDSLEEWYQAQGLSKATVGIIDCGINRVHEDLNEVGQIGPYLWQEADYCGSHATKMAGMAAALTNNALGVAGVCPNCSLLDIAVIKSPPGGLQDCPSVSDVSISPDVIPQYVLSALSWSSANPEYHLSALNLAVGDYVVTETIDALWIAYLLGGVVTAVSSGNTTYSYPVSNYPQACPFTIAAGGFTWTGDFWEPCTSCYEGSSKGTTVGFGSVDVSAPASGTMLTTHSDMAIPYAYSSSQTSGAAAHTSGALGFLQSIWFQDYSSDPAFLPPPGYLRGFLVGSALDFPTDPSQNPNRTCVDCPRSDYGAGRLNVAGALRLMRAYAEPDANGVLQEHELGPGDFTMLLAKEFEVWNADNGEFETWRQWQLTAEVALIRNTHSELPPYSAFLLPEQCNLFPYVDLDQSDEWLETYAIHMVMNCEIGCHLLTPDAQGNATIVGALYAKHIAGSDWEWINIDANDVTVTYVSFSSTPSGIDGPGSEMNSKGSPTLLVASPAPLPMRMEFGLTQEGAVDISLYDVTGRRVSQLLSRYFPAGRNSYSWDGSGEGPDRLPGGTYWLRLQQDNAVVTRRVVVLR